MNENVTRKVCNQPTTRRDKSIISSHYKTNTVHEIQLNITALTTASMTAYTVVAIITTTII